MTVDAINWRRLYQGYDSTPEIEAEAAARLGIVWRPASTDRARRRGELPAFVPVDAANLAANAVRTASGCLEWSRARNRRGRAYGALWLDSRRVLAHRLSLERMLGRPLGPGMMACHTCDNPPCIEPDHLFEGSAATNNRDMRAKGRWRRRAA